MRPVDEIASLIYTPANIDRAKEYLARRGLSYDTACPFVATDSQLLNLTSDIRPYSLTDALIMPVPSVSNPRHLAGFSIRYIGTNPNRLRYLTIKADPKQVFCYYTQHLFQNINKPVFVTESVLDAESLTQSTGHLAISFMSAFFQPQIFYWLLGISNHIVFALDNDQAGNRCYNKYLQLYQQMSAALSLTNEIRIQRLSLPCKDINECLCTFGTDFLRNHINSQLL